jgi:hypothetical protein
MFITLSIIILDSASNGFIPATEEIAYASKFPDEYAHRIIKDTGHNPRREVPTAFADAVVELTKAG